MRLAACICLTLLIASSNVAQELNSKYNRVEDRTNVSTKSRTVKGASLNVLFYFNHKGEVIKEPIAAVGMVIDSASSDWKFLKRESLRLYVLADGERFNVDGTRYASNVHTGRRTVVVSERLVFALTVDQLRTLCNSKSVELQLGSEEFTLTDKIVKDARAILALL